jgi:hypothetical protein
MQLKIGIIAAALAVVAVAAGPQHPLSVSVANAGCGYGERIDASSAADAMHKLQAEGYRDVRDLKKGCDNFWYGYANKDGREEHVSLSPAGEVQVQHE